MNSELKSHAQIHAHGLTAPASIGAAPSAAGPLAAELDTASDNASHEALVQAVLTAEKERAALETEQQLHARALLAIGQLDDGLYFQRRQALELDRDLEKARAGVDPRLERRQQHAKEAFRLRQQRIRGDEGRPLVAGNVPPTDQAKDVKAQVELARARQALQQFLRAPSESYIFAGELEDSATTGGGERTTGTGRGRTTRGRAAGLDGEVYEVITQSGTMAVDETDDVLLSETRALFDRLTLKENAQHGGFH